MRGSLKTLYKQVYNLAYDLAKKAEKTYCFERGVSNANFIQSGYFDAGREGLLAGEQFYVGLKQLEAAYQEKRGYDYELTKHVSLRQLDPFALLQLKAGNTCIFDIPEVLFDMDFPGHYKRRIKSVSISIPCIAGPYTGVNATLRLLNNKFRNSAITANYPEKADETDERFVTYNIPVTGIATSSGQNDPGMFELNFKEERYLSFEGAGVISSWSLEFPSEIRQFNYNTISDAIIHIRYTANEGGNALKIAANSAVKNQLAAIKQGLDETGLHVAINMKQDMPKEWNLLKANGTIGFIIDRSRLPYMAQSFETAQIGSVMFVAKIKYNDNAVLFTINVNGVAANFTKVDELNLFKGFSSEIKLNTLFILSVSDTDKLELEELLLIVKYSF